MRIAYTKAWKGRSLDHTEPRILIRSVWICPINKYPSLEECNDCHWIVPGTELEELGL